MSNVINQICQWLGYTLHDGSSYNNQWTTTDGYVIMTGCIIIIAITLTIISLVNRILNRFFGGKS